MNTCNNPHLDFPLRIPTTSPPQPFPPPPPPLTPTTTPITLTTTATTPTFQHAVVSVLPNNYASSPSFTCFNQQQQQQNPRKKRSKLIMRPDSPAKRPKPAKKPDPSAPKITKPCSECGRKFWSWKALFGHMRCHPERQWRGIDPPTDFRRPALPDRVPNLSMGEDDHEAASSLLMLASGADQDRENDVVVCRFECSSCKKVFGSHQALGGHRASHKNVKGCFAITKSDVEIIDHQDQHNTSHISTSHAMFPSDDGFQEITEDNNKTMVHQCSICFRVFSSGQALGGHKRCHWDKGDDPSSSSSLLNMTQLGLNSSNATTSAGLESAGPHLLGGLDLNLPAGTSASSANVGDGDDQSSSYSSSGHNLDLRLGL